MNKCREINVTDIVILCTHHRDPPLPQEEEEERMIIVSVTSSRVHTRVEGYSRSKPASWNHYSLMGIINHRSSANPCATISPVAVVNHVLIIANTGLVVMVKGWSIDARSSPRFEVVFRDFQNEFWGILFDNKRFLVSETTTINQ